MWLAIAAGYFALALVVHSVLVRVFQRRGAFFNFLIAGSLSGAVLVAQLATRRFDDAAVATLLLYALGCELYIFLFSMVSTSVSVSILLTLGRHSITEQELDRVYSSRDMVARRLERLVTGGFLAQTRDGAYCITASGHRFIARFGFLRAFFGHQHSHAPSQPESTFEKY
jgi:ABC-type siderophore export system fused ATPase/permease subunit